MIRCACGENYAASYLSGMGLIVAFPRAGSPLVDLTATSDQGVCAISLQVKTGGFREIRSTGIEWSWNVGRKAMDVSRVSNSFFYVFIHDGGWPATDFLPEVFSVPSKVVAETLKANTPNQADWFWFNEQTATKYRGQTGFAKLAKALRIKQSTFN